MGFNMFDETPEAREERKDARQAIAAINGQPSIFERAIVLQLETSRLGVRRKVNARDVNESNAASDLLFVSKSILESKELTAITAAQRELRAFVAGRASGPAFLNRGGFHLLANSLVEETDAGIVSRVNAIAVLVEKFLTVYEQRAAETREKLGTLAPTTDEYPSVARVRDAFSVAWRYLSFSTPGSLSGIKAEIFEREREKAAGEWAEALGECRQVLRAAFADLVDHLAERLTPDPETSKPRKFKDSLVKNFEEFAATFNARNIADDAQLADLVERARGVMVGVEAKDLRTNDGLRAAVAQSMADIKAAIDPLVVDVPTRRYSEDG